MKIWIKNTTAVGCVKPWIYEFHEQKTIRFYLISYSTEASLLTFPVMMIIKLCNFSHLFYYDGKKVEKERRPHMSNSGKSGTVKNIIARFMWTLLLYCQHTKQHFYIILLWCDKFMCLCFSEKFPPLLRCKYVYDDHRAFGMIIAGPHSRPTCCWTIAYYSSSWLSLCLSPLLSGAS